MPVLALVAAGARLGLSLGKIFGRNGFDVALLARSADRLDDLTGKLAAEGVRAAGFGADVTDPAALVAALDAAADRFGPVDVLHYAAPAAGRTEDVRRTGALDVTVDALRPQLDSICFGAVTATRAVLPGMLARRTGTVLFTTGAAAVSTVPVFVGAGVAGAALHNWALALNAAVAGRGVHVGHVAIGAWLAGTPGAPESARRTEPDDLARRYWDMYTDRGPAEVLVTG